MKSKATHARQSPRGSCPRGASSSLKDSGTSPRESGDSLRETSTRTRRNARRPDPAAGDLAPPARQASSVDVPSRPPRAGARSRGGRDGALKPAPAPVRRGKPSKGAGPGSTALKKAPPGDKTARGEDVEPSYHIERVPAGPDRAPPAAGRSPRRRGPHAGPGGSGKRIPEDV
ncbi:MAG TPA: hypothetical protein VMT52_12115, partial [Planctomycetota bacterium]|nr:hypothetical protein [Planctomycetota bacterium]